MNVLIVELRCQSSASRTATVLSVPHGYLYVTYKHVCTSGLPPHHVQAHLYISVTYVTRKCQQHISVV
eukprot:1612336-Ditylum_brightwellii.AAC.1